MSVLSLIRESFITGLTAISCFVQEYIKKDRVTEQSHNQIAAQKLQQSILKLLWDELGVNAILPEAVSKELILQV